MHIKEITIVALAHICMFGSSYTLHWNDISYKMGGIMIVLCETTISSSKDNGFFIAELLDFATSTYLFILKLYL